MAIHRFTINVPNPTARKISVQLQLERAKLTDLLESALAVPESVLEAGSAVITLDPCAIEGNATLKLTLEPYMSQDVHVVIDITSTGQAAIAAYHLIDQRRGKTVGGVLLTCIDPPDSELPGVVVPTSKPCPIVLSTDLYTILPDTDPRTPSGEKVIPPGTNLELVASIVNPTSELIRNIQVYLEHLGESNAEFMPGTWSIGTLEPGEVFYATWSIQTTTWQVGVFNACVIVVSEDMNPVRLNGAISIGNPRNSARG